MSEVRFDFSRLASKSVTKISGGGVRIPAHPTRTGVFEYRRPDGSLRREYRSPEEVFHADSLASYADAPVVVGHPKMLDTADRPKYQKGHVSGIARQDGLFVATDLAVTDPDTITRADAGDICEISCGYHCDFDDTPGEVDGQQFDGQQKNIRINHIGLGPRGWARGGSELTFRLDGVYTIDEALQSAEETMIKFDGKEYATPDELVAAIRADAKAEKDRLDARITALEADVKSAAEAVAKARTDGQTAVDQRVKLVLDAQRIQPECKFDGRSNDDIRKEIVSKVYPDVKLDGRSSDYISALFDQAVLSGKRVDGIDSIATAIETVQRQDAQTEEPKPLKCKQTPHKWAAERSAQ